MPFVSSNNKKIKKDKNKRPENPTHNIPAVLKMSKIFYVF